MTTNGGTTIVSIGGFADELGLLTWSASVWVAVAFDLADLIEKSCKPSEPHWVIDPSLVQLQTK